MGGAGVDGLGLSIAQCEFCNEEVVLDGSGIDGASLGSYGSWGANSASLACVHFSIAISPRRSRCLNTLCWQRWWCKSCQYLATSLGELLVRALPERFTIAVTPPPKYPDRSRSIYPIGGQ